MRWQALMTGVLISATLSACATPSARDSGKAQVVPTTAGRFDEARMAAIERQARISGVDVYWVNPPRAPKQKP